jgi:tRNA-splicing ligase RtcB
MISKKDLVKINDYLWEIPKTFRADMRVPARIYVSEKMLENVFRDKSLIQLVNLCCLPGIQKYGIVMPDCHEGYASPIGGVAAIEAGEGIISPGMCLKGNTKVLHSLGFYLPINKFNHIGEEIRCADLVRKNIDKAAISKFWKLRANPCLVRLTTKHGQKIEATLDHPFYTPKGMVPLGNLKEGDKIALYPFEGVVYQEAKEKILVDEKKIKKCWTSLNQDPAGHGFQQIINQLKKRNLLPLKTTSPQFPYLLKIMGYLLGDGTISFRDRKISGQTAFYGREENLKLIKKDIERVGFRANIYKRWRKHKIRTSYADYRFQREEISLSVRGSSFAILIWALGMPVGNKTKQDFILPRWIFTLPLWQKRLFLAGLFGAELSSPKSIPGHGFNFYSPVLVINKNERYVKSGKKILMQIAEILGEFDVKKRKIITRKEYKNNRQKISYRHRLVLSSKPENLINLWSKVGYEYQQEKQFLANLAVHFIKAKQKFIEEKILSRGIKAQKGLVRFKKSQLVFLRGLIKKGGRNLARPFVGQFPTFEDFINETTRGLAKSSLVWDEIEKIEKIPFNGYVYDFTVADPSHNFIANNFVVSNCGYDINCGMRLLKSEYSEKEIKPYLNKLASEIQAQVPSGLGQGRKIKLTTQQVDKILNQGTHILLKQGYGEKEDVENCEATGRLVWADSAAVSEQAKNRGRDQVGTLGSGNHFLEIQKVEEIFDHQAAKAFGLFKDQIVLMVHSGSRGLGHQICTDYLRKMISAMQRYKIRVPDREFACVPFNSPEGQQYFAAMAAAANYAWANRYMIAYYSRKAWQKVLGREGRLKALYDVAHNIIKKEKYNIDGKETEVIVHRKGATRAFPPGHSEIPERYRQIGQPVLIPGSMGTASYILVGSKKGEEAFFSTCHGAGRTMSRHAAMRAVSGSEVVRNLENKGIIVKCRSFRGIAEEAPLAYKDIDSVVEVVHQAELSKKVAKLKPLVAIKGE